MSPDRRRTDAVSTLPTWVSQSSTDRGVVAPITARARDALQAVLRARRRGQRSDLRLMRRGVERIYYGTILTGDQYLHCERTRNRLHHELGGMAVEMEGGAVAQICASFDIPWLVIRALSDLAGADSGVDFNRFVGEVAASSARVLLRLLPVLTAC